MTDEVKNASLEALRRRWDFEKSPKLTLQLAEEYGRARDHLGAITVLRAGLEAHPGHVASRVLLGRYLVELEQWDEARETLEGVTEGDPTHLVANKLLVQTYLATGQRTEARNRLDLYNLLNASDPDVEELEERLAEAPEEVGPEPTREQGVEEERRAVAAPGEGVEEPPGPSARQTVRLEGDVEPEVVDREVALSESEPELEAESEPESESEPEPEPEPELGAEVSPLEALEEAAEDPFGESSSAGGEGPGGSAAAAEPFGDLWSNTRASRNRRVAADGEVFDLEPAGDGPHAARPAESIPSVQAPPPAESISTAGEEAPGATVTLGNLYLDQGHHREAARIFTEVLEREGDNAAAREGLAAATAGGEGRLTARDLLAPEALLELSPEERKRALLEAYLERLASSRPTPAAGGSR